MTLIFGLPIFSFAAIAWFVLRQWLERTVVEERRGPRSGEVRSGKVRSAAGPGPERRVRPAGAAA